MTARTTPQGLAPLLQLLELEQPTVITSTQMVEYARDAGIEWPTDLLVRRLREHGWLLPLATKGVWEFAPAARAGAFGSGDPFIELRAVLARNPERPLAVAAESAAFLLGLSSRRPEPECVGATPGERLPKALAEYRVVRWRPTTPYLEREGLPVWSPATLLVSMASRPSTYHDWPNVGEWLVQAVAQLEVDAIARELEGRPSGAWARAAYLIHRGGAPEGAQLLQQNAPKAKGPHYLGDRSSPGRYMALYDVIDSTGLEVGGA
jgi:hypothetical protein